MEENKKTFIKEIILEPVIGADIHDVIIEAINISYEQNSIVTFYFNKERYSLDIITIFSNIIRKNKEENLLEENKNLAHKKKVKDLEDSLKLEKKCFEDIETFLIGELGTAGLTSFKNENGVSATVSPKKKFSILVEDKPKLYEWLRENEVGDLIKESVHEKTLNSFFNKDWIDIEGNEKPRPEFIKKYEFKKLSILGGKK